MEIYWNIVNTSRTACSKCVSVCLRMCWVGVVVVKVCLIVCRKVLEIFYYISFECHSASIRHLECMRVREILRV